MTTFLISILKMTLIQLLGVLGIFFAFGFVLSKLQEWTQHKYQKVVGWKGILWTAWIGTPFHELGHYFFAKLFRHKIIRFRIFEPNKVTGELGHLDHSYSKFSLYQKVGNFFIGAAPMIFGSAMLALLVYFILPNGKEVFLPLTEANNTIQSILIAAKKTLLSLFSFKNIVLWNFWVFLYLSFCIASHLAPSRADRKGMWSGLFYIFLILLLVNIFSVLFKLNTTAYILQINQYLGIFTAIFLYATIISLIHFVFSYIILTIIEKIKG